MIAGVGIDLVDVGRMAEKLEHDQFRQKVFSPGEIAYCEPMPDKAQHYAARFAVKEAFLKAAGVGLTVSYELSEIEVVHTEKDRPVIKLSGVFLTMSQERGWSSMIVSLSHIKEVATAIVIIEQ